MEQFNLLRNSKFKASCRFLLLSLDLRLRYKRIKSRAIIKVHERWTLTEKDFKDHLKTKLRVVKWAHSKTSRTLSKMFTLSTPSFDLWLGPDFNDAIWWQSSSQWSDGRAFGSYSRANDSTTAWRLDFRRWKRSAINNEQQSSLREIKRQWQQANTSWKAGWSEISSRLSVNMHGAVNVVTTTGLGSKKNW